MTPLILHPLGGIGEIAAGADLAGVLCAAITRCGLGLQPHDLLVVAQKVVSKAEDRFVDLRSVEPSARALELAGTTGKDARLVELILRESSDVLRVRPNVLIVRHRLGYVLAQAGIDRSNVPGDERVLLLPIDPDASATSLREALLASSGVDVGVVITDSFGRPWRLGTTNVAIGSAGIPSLWDRRGERDRAGRALESTLVAWADAIAAAAGLLMGEAAEGVPAVLVRGLACPAVPNPARSLVRPLDEDLFR
jgi:coenzyme F420-0:L-glutamate ligase / coenzyme F420-1:gamma-L-glutamate ligase